jgi:hypothetical protein
MMSLSAEETGFFLTLGGYPSDLREPPIGGETHGA